MNLPAGEYTFSTTARILGLTEAKLRYWSQSGFVGPSLRRSGRQVYSFQDLISVRAAKELVDRGFAPAQIRRALDQIKTKLPAIDRPLDKLRIAWDGATLTFLDEGGAYTPSGQRLFDFALSDLADQAAQIVALAQATAENPMEGQETAYDWFVRGLAADEEKRDAKLAAAFYRRALACDPGFSAAHCNLGILAYRAGDLSTARSEFQTALSLDPDQPEARYNLAHLLLEEGNTELAASELRQVVKDSPSFADAHFNLASALEHLGSKNQAAEHLRRYLELSASSSEGGNAHGEEAKRRLRRLEAQRDLR